VLLKIIAVNTRCVLHCCSVFTNTLFWRHSNSLINITYKNMKQHLPQSWLRDRKYQTVRFSCFIAIALCLFSQPSLAQFHQNLSFRSLNNTVVDCGTMAAALSNATAFTVEARVKFNVFTLWGTVFAMRISQLDRDIVLQSYSTTGAIGVGVANGYGYSTTALVPEVWYHLAIVYDGSQTTDPTRLKLYINGVLESLTFFLTGVPAVSPVATGARFIVGAEYDGTAPINGSTFVLVPFDGAVDELRIWNTARSQADIQANMNAELTLPQAGLASYYQFNQGIACGANAGLTTVPDLAGTNNGTLWNFALSGSLSNYTTVVDTSVTVNGSTLTANASPATYQWFDCTTHSTLGGQTANSYTAPGAGSYSVIVTQGACIDTSDCRAVTVTSTSDLLADDRVMVYPNPSGGDFHVVLPEQGGEIVIVDLAGREVLRTRPAERTTSLHLERSGVYFVRVVTKSGTVSQKIAVQ
jgi:hypothetical protein